MGASSGNSATRDAERAERERQAKLDASVKQIDAIFGSPARQAQYDDFFGATRGLYRDELGRKQKENSRQLKFSLARSGNTGGSLAVDQGRDLAESFSKGLVEADRMAQSDLSGIKSADDDARLRLISMAQSGLDTTTGIRQASSALQSSLQAGRATTNVKAIGDVFSGFDDIFKRSREERSRRQGEQYAYNTLYQPGYFTGQQGRTN